MSEVLIEFDTTMTARDSTRWVPRACGRVADDGLWEGWIEFLSMDDTNNAIRTGRETEQPNRDDLMYWAQGLTEVYLEGALTRARAERETAEPTVGSPTHFEGPRPHPMAAPTRAVPRPILNPFEVYQQGQDVLIQELGALSPGHLRDIALAYRFGEPDEVDGAGREALSSMIIAGVRRPLGEQRPAAETERRV